MVIKSGSTLCKVPEQDCRDVSTDETWTCEFKNQEQSLSSYNLIPGEAVTGGPLGFLTS